MYAIMDKLLFYSVISSFHLKRELGKIKKTCTVLEGEVTFAVGKLWGVLGIDVLQMVNAGMTRREIELGHCRPVSAGL